MIACVLSGGANRNPWVTGTLQSLVVYNITADLAIGTSAGALNGVYDAHDPTRRQIDEAINLDAWTSRVLSGFRSNHKLT